MVKRNSWVQRVSSVDGDKAIGLAMAAGIVAGLAFLVATCGGCGGAVDVVSTVDHGDDAGDVEDAMPDHGSDAGVVDARADAHVDASPDAAPAPVCCRTGQNVLVCDPTEPFPCYPISTHVDPVPCTDPACVTGIACAGFPTANGEVVTCGQ